MKYLLPLLWLGVLPSVAMLFASYWFNPCRGIDTSQEAAARIRPGMTMAEVEQIIGGPPGDYRYRGATRFQKVSGNRWPYTQQWTTFDGQIEIADGYYGIQYPPDNGAKVYPGSESWSTADGVIDSVKWSPAEQPTITRLSGDAILLRTVICFGLPLVCYLVWTTKRHPDPIPSSSNST
ncbi:MAG: hypothetical protein K8U57_35750 [Planctomycetes bacterium]|nr:hypothetical protein [Planctomycetota bacterium]